MTHILDWFHLSMRLRHIEQTWQCLRHIGDLNIYLRDVAVDVPRLRYLLWSGYVREATRAVKNMLYQLEQHATLRGANQKLKRLSVLINNLQSYLVKNTTSIVDYSNGGKERIGRITKHGNKQLRTLLIAGATSILKQARRALVFVKHLTDETSALQGRRRSTGQQDRAHDLGASYQRRHLQSTGDHGESIEHKESRRLGSGMKRQGAKSVMNPRDDNLDTDMSGFLNAPSSASK